MADGYGFIKRDMDAFMGEDITVRKNTAIYAAMQNIIKVLESDASKCNRYSSYRSYI